MHSRTGDSSAIGSGCSAGAVVTVGLGTSPGLSDQIEAPVVCSVEQYAVAPLAVVAVLPTGEHLAPITATGAAGDVAAGGATGSGGGGSGMNVGVLIAGDFAVAVVGSGRSARRNSVIATVIAPISSIARIAGTMMPARSRERFGGVAAGARVVATSPVGAASSPWASARAKSSHRSKRSLGSLDNALANTGSSADSSGRRTPIAGGDADRCWLMTTAGLE